MQLNLANPKSYGVAKDLRDTTSKLQAIGESISDLVNGRLDEISNEIENKSAELEALQIKLDETRRVKTLDLELMIRKDRQDAFNKLAGELSYAVITSDQLAKTLQQLATAQADREADIETAVKSAQNKVYAEKGGEINALKAAHQVATAELEAQNKMLHEKVLFLTEQINRLNQQLTTAQEAQVKIAEASKAPVINTSGK